MRRPSGVAVWVVWRGGVLGSISNTRTNRCLTGFQALLTRKEHRLNMDAADPKDLEMRLKAAELEIERLQASLCEAQSN